MKIWIYRPDIEAKARKINRAFLYNRWGEDYFTVIDRENKREEQIENILEEQRREASMVKIEVPR